MGRPLSAAPLVLYVAISLQRLYWLCAIIKAINITTAHNISNSPSYHLLSSWFCSIFNPQFSITPGTSSRLT